MIHADTLLNRSSRTKASRFVADLFLWECWLNKFGLSFRRQDASSSICLR